MPDGSTARTRRLHHETGVVYFPIALIARLPFAMVVVGVMTLIVPTTGSLALGGTTAAVVGVGNACFGPFLGVLADRYGQRKVILTFSTVNSVLLFSLVAVTSSDYNQIAMFIIAFLIGASSPQVAPLSRSRLVGIIDSSFPHPSSVRIMNAAMAYESAADEIVFVFGPVIVGLLATTIGAGAPVIGAGIISLVFISAFALHKTAAQTTPAHVAISNQAPARDLFRLSVIAPVLGAFGMGLLFGSMLTSLTAFMVQRNEATQVGLVYGIIGLGSAVMALSVAFLPAKYSHQLRWLVFGSLSLVGTLSLLWANSVAQISLSLLIIGLGIGPTLVTQYTLAAQASPAGRSATVMTLVGTAITVGSALASAATGIIAQAGGPSLAFTLPIFSCVVVLAAAIVNGFGSRR